MIGKWIRGIKSEAEGRSSSASKVESSNVINFPLNSCIPIRNSNLFSRHVSAVLVDNFSLSS